MPVDAQCPDLAALPFDELLAGPATGGIVRDGLGLAVSEVDIGDFDGTVGVVATIGDDYLILPLDAGGDPTGTALWVTDDAVLEGPVDLAYDEPTGALSFPTSTLAAADGSDEISVAACLLIGTGSSQIVIDGTTATIDGTLGSLTYIQVERIQAEVPLVDALVLHDVPGSINDEINVETGRLVRNAGWSTMVPADGVIASGGVDLFCAGASRSIDEGAMLGVHSWSDGAMDGIDYPPDHPAHDMQLAYFTEMLGSPNGPDFYWFTLQAAPAAEIHWMTATEIAQYQLVTP